MAFSEKSFIQSLYCPPTEDDDDDGDDDAGASRPWSVNNDNRGEANKKKSISGSIFSSTSVLSQKYKSIQDIMMGMMSPEFFLK